MLVKKWRSLKIIYFFSDPWTKFQRTLNNLNLSWLREFNIQCNPINWLCTQLLTGSLISTSKYNIIENDCLYINFSLNIDVILILIPSTTREDRGERWSVLDEHATSFVIGLCVFYVIYISRTWGLIGIWLKFIDQIDILLKVQ